MLTFIESEHPLYFQEEIVDIAGIFLEDDTVQLAAIFKSFVWVITISKVA